MSEQPHSQDHHLFIPHSAPTTTTTSSSSEHDLYPFDLEAKDNNVPQYSPTDVTQNDQVSSFDQNVFNPMFDQATGNQPQQIYQPTPFYPDNSTHTLSHASSYSSLTSSTSASDMGSGHGLWVTTDESPYDSPLAHSRNSSFSFTPNVPLETFPNPQWTMPTFPLGQAVPMVEAKQPLSIETRLGRTSVDRFKGSYRSQPYSRQRSESISLKSEADDDVTALLSASTNASVVTPWTQTPWQNPLVQGVDKMTLHHRRTSSAASNLHMHQSSPRRPMLSRSHRSSTLSGMKRPSPDLLAASSDLITGTAEEREETVHRLLRESSQAILALSTVSAQDKARGTWVRQWLRLCYTPEKESTVPRQGLYHSYTMSCSEHGLRPINSASFGKAVRNAYPGIKTRRLGHRGNSKYHYVSLRPAIRTEATRLNAYGDSSGHWHVAPEDGSMAFQASESVGELEMLDDTDEDEEEDEVDDGNDTFDTGFNHGFPTHPFMAQETTFSRPAGMARRHTTSAIHFEGVKMEIPTPVFNLIGFPCLADQPFVPGAPSAEAFWQSFCQHQEGLANCVRNLQWDNFNALSLSYWSSLSPEDADVSAQIHINELVVRGMARSYDHFIAILLDRLFINRTQEAQEATRNFAKNLQSTMETAMVRFSSDISQPRIELATRAAHLFCRFLDLQQVTTALGPYLTDHRQLKSLLVSWDKLDSRSIADQVMLSCNCEEELVQTILGEFRQWLSATLTSALSGEQAIRKLGDWIVNTLQALKTREPSMAMSRSIISKTCMFTSQVLRDFTLKSDTSFGIYQLVKTWIDDWTSIVVLRETALSIGNLEMHRMPPEMRVMIPSQTTENQPLEITTAVPIQQGLQGLIPFGAEAMVVSTPKPFNGPQAISI